MKELCDATPVTASHKFKMVSLMICAAIFVTVLMLQSAISRPSARAVMVQPGDDIEARVAGLPAGTSFDLAPGVYGLQSIRPKDGDIFTGEAGAILSGAEVLTNFARDGRYWVTAVKVKRQNFYRGECDRDHPACMFPQDLFVDDIPLQRVISLSDVATGKWYLDYNDGKVYLSENPARHKVEISLIAHAFYGSAKNVTILGLTIEKYADTAGDGAIEGGSEGHAPSQGWVVKDNLVKLNHGMGIRLGNQMQVINNKILDNGQMGLGGSGDRILVAGNEIAYNNYAGYDCGWEAGGTKFTFTRDLVVRDNFVHNNGGPGLWTDIDNHNTLYENNRTRENKEAGILHEISYHAVIRDNTIQNDGFSASGKNAPWYGGGILITASQNVEIYGNTVTDCMNGIVGLQPDRKNQAGREYLLRNLYVHNNVIKQRSGIAAGILKAASFDNSVFTSWNNRFADNTFHLEDQGGKYFAWMNAEGSLVAWQGVHWDH